MVKTILVVDDSPTERFMTVDILSKAGYQVITAENAEEGIAKAKTMHPDLIVMDVVMPGMNGYQATRTLKKTVETKDIPIIVCTSKGQETDKIWGIRQGASDYLVKPVKAQELLQHIAAIGGKIPTPAATAKPATPASTTTPAKPAAPSATSKLSATPAQRPVQPAMRPAAQPIAPNQVAPQQVRSQQPQAAQQRPVQPAMRTIAPDTRVATSKSTPNSK